MQCFQSTTNRKISGEAHLRAISFAIGIPFGGKELFYRTDDWLIGAVPVIDLKQHRFGKLVTLFRLPDGAEYDVMSGKRFLVNEPVGPATAPLFVIANWKPELAKSE